MYFLINNYESVVNRWHIIERQFDQSISEDSKIPLCHNGGINLSNYKIIDIDPFGSIPDRLCGTCKTCVLARLADDKVFVSRQMILQSAHILRIDDIARIDGLDSPYLAAVGFWNGEAVLCTSVVNYMKGWNSRRIHQYASGKGWQVKII